ncbi:MAG: S49 family peptidase [Desulfarculaceae bacterium]|jgi:protease-4
MGGVAASGGYYIAAPCTKIVASRGTITGSIGVITAIPNLEGLLDKIGIKVQTLKAGSLKGAGQINRALTEPERAMLQAALDDIHRQFIEDVAKARKLPKTKVAEIANGGIFTGRRAKQLGLVDELGNFQDAVRLAARLAGIKGRPQLVTPERESKSWLSRLFREQASAWIRDLMAELTHRPYQGPMYLYQPPKSAP